RSRGRRTARTPTRDSVSGRGRTARVPPGVQGRRRAAAGKAGAADFPEPERAAGGDASAPRRTRRRKGLQFCRAGFAGRGTALARSTDATRSLPFPTRDKVSGRSPEHRLHLLEEALRQRVHLLARDAGELLEQLPLPGRELARRLDEHADDLVSPTVAVQVGDAASLQLEDLARLGARGDLRPRLAVERGHLDLRPQRGLREAERDLAHHVGPLADEKRMLAHEGRLLEADLEVVAEILPAPHAAASAARPAGAEEVAEQVADDVLEVAAEVEARAPRRALLEGGVSEAVVEAPPLRVGEHLV